MLATLLPVGGDRVRGTIGRAEVDRWQPVFVVAGVLVAAFISA